MNLFAYGTLMDFDTLVEVSGCRPCRKPATLNGYSRHPVRNEVYPALVENTKSRVTGVLYLDLPESAWMFLDRFEGKMYRRVSVTVQDCNNIAEPAETYLCRPEFRHLLENSAWSFEDFLQSGGKEIFANESRGFR
ncbi:MAG: gamma-glutamylcyclotransferase [Proteobacteria bacterium]|nr:gamma-glutamylcyclotransferase [Pseudomonadota bacterium]MBU1737394.1 gamma-glutamylcyclotransferase [Pseudomonadota bacterium]